MYKLYKVLLCEILKFISCRDLLNFALTNKKYVGILDDEYFWKNKRLYDYSDYPFSDRNSYTEKEKYFRLRTSGYVITWTKYSDITDESIPFLLNGKKCLAKQVIHYDDYPFSGLYILDYQGILYRQEDNGYHLNVFRSEPRILAENVDKIYNKTTGVYIKTRDGTIYSHEKMKEICTNVEHFCSKNYTTFCLTYDHDLHINSRVKIPYKRTFKDVKHFTVFGKLLFYESQNKIFLFNFFEPHEPVKIILENKNISMMKCICYSLIYLTNDNILYELKFDMNQQTSQIDINVTKFWTDNQDTIYYYKNHTLYSKTKNSIKTISSITNIIDIQFVLCGFVKVALIQ